MPWCLISRFLGTSQKRWSIYLFLAAAVAFACLWFYADMAVADEITAIQEAEEAAAKAAADAARAKSLGGGFFGDAVNWTVGAAETVGETAVDVGEGVAKFATKSVGIFTDPLGVLKSWFLDIVMPIIKPIFPYFSPAIAGVSSVISGYWAWKSDYKWVKRLGGLTAVLMILAAIASVVSPTAMGGWGVKVLAVAAVISAGCTCVALWKDPAGGQPDARTPTFPGHPAPMGLASIAPGAAGALQHAATAGRSGIGTAGTAGRPGLPGPQSRGPPPPYSPPPPQYTAPPQQLHCSSEGRTYSSEGSVRPKPPTTAPPPWTPERGEGQTRREGESLAQPQPWAGPGWSTSRRRLIEQKFRFSDHSLLIAALMGLVCAAFYCFTQESNFDEMKKSTAYIVKKSPAYL